MIRTLRILAAVTLLAVTPAATGPVCAKGGCCKTCSAGKACGDSCISRDKACKKGRGCACNG